MQGKMIKQGKQGGLDMGKRYTKEERQEALKLVEEIGAAGAARQKILCERLPTNSRI